VQITLFAAVLLQAAPFLAHQSSAMHCNSALEDDAPLDWNPMEEVQLHREVMSEIPFPREPGKLTQEVIEVKETEDVQSVHVDGVASPELPSDQDQALQETFSTASGGDPKAKLQYEGVLMLQGLREGMARPIDQDSKGAEIMRWQRWEEGKGLGKDCTGRTDNIPFPLGFVEYTASTWSSSWGKGWEGWGAAESWSSHTGSASSAWGVGPQHDSQPAWFDSASWAEGPITFNKQTDPDQDPVRVSLEKLPATEEEKPATWDDHHWEEPGWSEQMMKTTKKKSKNKGAHKRWMAENMLPDDYGHEHPKWVYWSGKLGWEGFAKSSWDWLDKLHKEAYSKKTVIREILEVGGWKYSIHMDPFTLWQEEHCGFQVALHQDSNEKPRKIKKCW